MIITGRHPINSIQENVETIRSTGVGAKPARSPHVQLVGLEQYPGKRLQYGRTPGRLYTHRTQKERPGSIQVRVVETLVRWFGGGVAVSEGKSIENWSRQTASGTIPLILGGSLGAAVACFVILTVAAPSSEPFFEDPPRSLVAGLGLLGLACPLYVAAFLLRGQSAGARCWGRSIAATAFSVGSLCSALGLVGIVRGVYPFARFVVNL